MDGLTVLVVLLSAGAGWAVQAVLLRRKRKRQEHVNDLQLHRDDAGLVHFPSMLYRTQQIIQADAPPPDLYRLQRLGDGTWQKQATEATLLRKYYRDCYLYRRQLDREAWKAHNKDLVGWQPLIWPAMETAYQHFVPALTTLQVYPKLPTQWEEEDEKTSKEAELEATKLLP
jgi:hypothetical protein